MSDASPLMLLLAVRAAHQVGVVESVAYLRERAAGHVEAPGSAHRRSELRQAADVLDERVGRAEQRSRAREVAASPSPTRDPSKETSK